MNETTKTSSWHFTAEALEWACEPPNTAARQFHQRLAGYAPTPLIELPGLARSLKIGRLLVKDESARFDLGAFKYLGASWSVFRAVAEASDYEGEYSVSALSRWLRPRKKIALVTASDGNHGRAVARMAAELGLPARVYMPDVVPLVVTDRVKAEGAALTIVSGDYDEAIEMARRDVLAHPGDVIVQDTSWEGYEKPVSWIVEGYETLFGELDDQLALVGVHNPDLVAIPVGVGSLAQAAIAHYRSLARSSPTRLLSVEPDTAACVLESLNAGTLRSVATASTVMNGLNCGTPSYLAWPYISAGLDAAITITDEQVEEAMQDLAAAKVGSGPSGAAALAGVQAALRGPGADSRRLELGTHQDSVVVCINTEGPLDTSTN